MNVAGIANVRFDLDWTTWEKDHEYPKIADVLNSEPHQLRRRPQGSPRKAIRSDILVCLGGALTE